MMEKRREKEGLGKRRLRWRKEKKEGLDDSRRKRDGRGR
jgi:hypothetical protein